MFEFIRESLLCSSDDSPKRDLNLKRRPGEIISSQGTPLVPRAVASAPAMARRCHEGAFRQRRARTPSPLTGRLSSRSPGCSFRTAPSFREPLGGSLAYTGAAAAQQEELLPGRGLYVPMQRGIESRGASRSAAQRVRSLDAGSQRSLGLPAPPVAAAFTLPATGTAEEELVGERPSRPLQARPGVPPSCAWGPSGSFLVSEGGGLGGSFYSVTGRGDARLEAMRVAGAPPPPASGAPPTLHPTPLPPPPPLGTPGTPFFLRPEGQQPAAQFQQVQRPPPSPAARQAFMPGASAFAVPVFIAVTG